MRIPEMDAGPAHDSGGVPCTMMQNVLRNATSFTDIGTFFKISLIHESDDVELYSKALPISLIHLRTMQSSTSTLDVVLKSAYQNIDSLRALTEDDALLRRATIRHELNAKHTITPNPTFIDLIDLYDSTAFTSIPFRDLEIDAFVAKVAE